MLFKAKEDYYEELSPWPSPLVLISFQAGSLHKMLTLIPALLFLWTMLNQKMSLVASEVTMSKANISVAVNYCWCKK